VCNLYEYMLVRKSYNQMMRDLDWGIPTQQDELDIANRPEIRIRDVAPVIRACVVALSSPRCTGVSRRPGLRLDRFSISDLKDVASRTVSDA
jgi:hypothetical protein